MHMQKSTTTIQYPLDNDIMFALVMNDAELCRGLLERIFPGRKIRMLKVCDGSDVEVQNTIITGMISKSVRLDVLFEDDDSWYSIEMQNLRGRRRNSGQRGIELSVFLRFSLRQRLFSLSRENCSGKPAALIPVRSGKKRR